MFDSIKSFFDIIYDKSKSIGHRTAVFLSTIAFIVIIDLVFHFTYDIYISNKLTNLLTINELKNTYKGDSIEIDELNNTENRIKNSKHYSEYIPFYNNFRSECLKSKNIEINTTHIIKRTPITVNREDSIRITELITKALIDTSSKNIEKGIALFDSIKSKSIILTDTTITKSTSASVKTTQLRRSVFWSFLSSNFLFILISIFLLIVPFTQYNTSKTGAIIGVIAMEVILIITMLVAYWTSNLIPDLGKSPIWNYILNVIIHVGFILIVSKLISKNSEK